MGLARTIAVPSLFRRPARTLFSILGIAFGVATVVGVVTLDHTTMEGYARPRQAVERPDVEVTASGGLVGSSEAIEQLDGISVAAQFFQNEVVVRSATDAEARPMRSQLLAIEAEHAPSFGQFGLAAGADLEPGSTERQALVGPALVRKLDLEIGDEVVLARPVRPARKRCIDGELVPVKRGRVDRPTELSFRVVGVLTREGAGRSAAGHVVVVDHDIGLELYRGVRVQSRFWAAKDPGVDLERLRRTLGATYSYSLNKGVVIGQAADERAFRTGVRMLGLLALVLGLYVIFHTLSMSLTERVLEVGTLHALGATRGQIGRVFFVEAVLLAGSGAAAGLGLGIALAYGLSRLGVTTLGVDKFVNVFVVPWPLVLSLALVGFLVALVGSVYPLVAIGGADTVSALRGEEALRRHRGGAKRFQLFYAVLLALLVPGLYLVLVPVVGEWTGELVTVLAGVVGLLTFVVMLSLLMPIVLSGLCTLVAKPLTAAFPLAGRLATRAMKDAPARVGVSACALGLVAAGFVGLHGVTASLSGEVRVWAAEATDDKAFVRGVPAVDFEELAAGLAEFPGVVGVEKGSARQFAPFLLIASDADSMQGYGPFAPDAELAKRFDAERTVVLSRRVARDLEYAVGDFVRTKTADGDPIEYEVIAISDAYGYWPDPDERMYGVVSDRWMEKDFCVASDVVTEFSVRFDDSRPMDASGHLGVLDAAIRDVVPGADSFTIRPGVEFRDRALVDITRDFLLFDVLLALMAGLALLGVLNGQLLATLERTRELGVLSALGAAGKQIGGAMLLEAVVVGACGGTLGVLLGTGATPLVVSALDTIAGLDLPVVGAGAWIPASLFGSIAVAALASLYPIRRAMRVDAVRAVRTR